MTQLEMLLNHLSNGNSITQAEALDLFGIGRLASRISDLKGMGANIASSKIAVKNRYGDTVYVAQYRLIDK